MQLSLVERAIWVREAAGAKPVIPIGMGTCVPRRAKKYFGTLPLFLYDEKEKYMKCRYKIQWSKQAYKDYSSWQAKNPKIAKKIDSLINSINQDGLINGLGRPEALLNRKECTRRINDWHRLIYSAKDNVVTIVSCCDHTKCDQYLVIYD